MTTFESFEKIRRDAEELHKIEKEDNFGSNLIDPLWINYGGNSESYNSSFGKLVNEVGLVAHVVKKAQEYRDLKIPYCVLDLFSPLESWLKKVQKTNEIDGGVASTLSDPRNEKTKKADDRKNLYCVEGDIFKPEARRELYRVMDKLGIIDEGFGTVVARPYGGAKIDKGEEEYLIVYYALLRQIWSITSRHNGEIFCPVPTFLSKTGLFHKWVDVMRTQVSAGVELTMLETNMKITKHMNSKDKLPGLLTLT